MVNPIARITANLNKPRLIAVEWRQPPDGWENGAIEISTYSDGTMSIRHVTKMEGSNMDRWFRQQFHHNRKVNLLRGVIWALFIVTWIGAIGLAINPGMNVQQTQQQEIQK